LIGPGNLEGWLGLALVPSLFFSVDQTTAQVWPSVNLVDILSWGCWMVAIYIFYQQLGQVVHEISKVIIIMLIAYLTVVLFSVHIYYSGLYIWFTGVT